ncbi:MAG TPA: CopG family transcriptional regulator, partial [Microthrixaceae bacterium]|nr:CopG family transcriptional regulator [Microthrixaceae bacterium]
PYKQGVGGSKPSTPTPEPLGRGRSGRPAMGSGPAAPFPVRLDPELRAALDERAANDDTTASDVIREALRRYLEVS